MIYKALVVALLALNVVTPNVSSNIGFFACEVHTLGFNQAVSNALGNGTNSDGFIEGILFSDFKLDRNMSEAIVNGIHSELFPSVTEHVYTDCE